MRDLRYKEGPRRGLEVFLCGFVLALFALAPAIFPYGGRFIVRGDYIEQQVPFILETKRMFASGAPFWSWNTLFGGNFLGNYAFYTAGSPFVWALLPLPEAAIPYGISVMAMLKQGVAALTAYLYLRRFVKNTRYAQLGGLLYAFSGFTIINTQFYHFTDVIAVFPLVLLGIEDTFSEKRHPGGVALACTLNVLVNYYFFLGTVLFAVIYVVFRLFSVDWRGTRSLKRIIVLGFECGLGCLVAAVLLFPAAWAMMGISRTGRFMVFDAGERYELWDILERLRVLFMPIESSVQHAFYGNAASWASVGAFLPLLGMAGVFYSIFKKPLRWHHWLLLLLIVISMIMPVNRLFVLGSNNTYTRWWYGLVLILCLITVQAMDDYRPELRRDRMNMWASLGCWLLCTLLLAGPFLLPSAWLDAMERFGSLPGTVARFVRWQQGMELYATEPYRIFAVGAWALNFLLCCVACTPAVYKHGRVVLSLLCLCAVVNTAGFIYLNNEHQESGGNVGYMTSVDYYVYHELDQPGPHFEGTTYTHRVDAPPKILNYGMFINQPSISNFHSIRSKYLDDFLGLGGFGFSELPYAYPYDQQDGAVRTLLGVKTYYNYDEEHYPGAPEGFTYVGKDGDVSVYENEYALPLGFAYTHYTTPYHHGVSKENIGQVMLNALVLDSKNEIEMRDNFELLSEHETLLPWQDAAAERATMACYDVEMTTRGLTAKIDLEERLFVFFSVPYDRGWTATVNGEPAEVYRANYSFLGVMADPGEGIEIELSFFPRGLTQGIIVSIVAALALAGYVWFLRRRASSQAKV